MGNPSENRRGQLGFFFAAFSKVDVATESVATPESTVREITTAAAIANQFRVAR
jgi:hypothetical protein